MFIKPLLLSAFVAPSLALAGAPAPSATETTPNPFADRLTGDWRGLRANLANRGIRLDLESTHYYQGLLDGTGDKNWDYGGRLDAMLNLDTHKLGLWEGGGFNVHGAYFYGNLASNLGQAFLPTNTGMKLPLGDGNQWEATSIHFSQRLGDHAGMRLGKIDALDLLAGDPFFGGYGNRRFMNMAFVVPPNGLTPAVFYGSILNVKTAPFTHTLMVFDPEDRTTDYWPRDLFDEGVNILLSSNWTGKCFGRTTGVTLTGIYSTKNRVDLGEVLLPESFRTGEKDGSYHVGLQFSHLLQEDPQRTGSGLGLYVRGGFSDGNPNPFQSWISGGIGGKGIWSARPDDAFGAGVFLYSASDKLRDTLNPLIEIGDEYGMEIYYDFPIAPWINVEVDLQVINPLRRLAETAVIGGFRTNIRF